MAGEYFQWEKLGTEKRLCFCLENRIFSNQKCKNKGKMAFFLLPIGAVLFSVMQQDHISENNKTNQWKRSKNGEKIVMEVQIPGYVLPSEEGPCCLKHTLKKICSFERLGKWYRKLKIRILQLIKHIVWVQKSVYAMHLFICVCNSHTCTLKVQIVAILSSFKSI